jgi:hypothetical protein
MVVYGLVFDRAWLTFVAPPAPVAGIEDVEVER